MPPAPDPNQDQIAAYAAAQGQSQAALTLLATNQARNAAQSFTAWYDSAQIGPWAQQLAQFIEAVQGQSASTTDAYLSEVASLIKGSNVSPAGAVKVSGLRKGVSHTEVYGRSADQYRYARSIGKSEDEAQQTAVQTAIETAETDVQLAQRAQAQKFMVVKNVSGYRRIIHPELSAGGSCGLCVAASSNFYHKAELLPLHNRCKCSVMPIINGIDPGHVLNQSDLKALYQQAGGSTKAKDLSRVRYVVHDNGELGPILGPHGELPEPLKASGPKVYEATRDSKGRVTLNADQVDHQIKTLESAPAPEGTKARQNQLARIAYLKSIRSTGGLAVPA